MKERILTNWTWTRVAFLLLGTFVIIQALAGQQWFVVLWGAYFASMGLFGFGCASGACAVSGTFTPTDTKTASPIKFEEVKSAKDGQNIL
jgi:hypothetical protein